MGLAVNGASAKIGYDMNEINGWSCPSSCLLTIAPALALSVSDQR